jgi:DNA polymerase elongation subunit (family B)
MPGTSGRIEAHEAITAYSREALLRAKETAESLGYTEWVLHDWSQACFYLAKT